ncbi:MAG: TetR/AcrR family transcriptional regulator [Chloroflexota bacterium]|nr:TetR/AcrR family transcriptional regulator [Chloroflexota bacterium]
MPKDTFKNLPEEKRRKILDIAIEEFAAHPYNVASISKIVRKAGIAKGSIYQYFENKKELYRYLVKISSDEKLKLTKDLPTPDHASGLFGYMRWQFLSEVYFEIHHHDMAQIAFRAFVEGDPFPEMTEELRQGGTTLFFKQLVSQGIMHGEVLPWVDPDVAAFIMEGVFYQFGRYFIKRLYLTEQDFIDGKIYDDPEAQQLLSNLMDILEAGMKRDPEQRRDQ